MMVNSSGYWWLMYHGMSTRAMFFCFCTTHTHVSRSGQTTKISQHVLSISQIHNSIYLQNRTDSNVHHDIIYIYVHIFHVDVYMENIGKSPHVIMSCLRLASGRARASQLAHLLWVPRQFGELSVVSQGYTWVKGSCFLWCLINETWLEMDRNGWCIYVCNLHHCIYI